MGCIALVRCMLVLHCGLAEVVWYPDEGMCDIPAKLQHNTNMHRTRAIQPMK